MAWLAMDHVRTSSALIDDYRSQLASFMYSPSADIHNTQRIRPPIKSILDFATTFGMIFITVYAKNRWNFMYTYSKLFLSG